MKRGRRRWSAPDDRARIPPSANRVVLAARATRFRMDWDVSREDETVREWERSDGYATVRIRERVDGGVVVRLDVMEQAPEGRRYERERYDDVEAAEARAAEWRAEHGEHDDE
ncbi:hypothetical protein JCM17823_09890 [Halorubrum gandharaense]